MASAKRELRVRGGSLKNPACRHTIVQAVPAFKYERSYLIGYFKTRDPRMFVQDVTRSPSSETQGQLVGAGKSQNSGEKKSRRPRRAPGDKVLTDQFQTAGVILASDWCQKTFVFFCPITDQQD